MTVDCCNSYVTSSIDAQCFLGFRYRAESVLPADPETVFRYIDPLPGSVREKWDKAIKELQIVERMGDVSG